MGDIRWQCGCCICCGGPVEFSRESMRRDKVVARSINFIEGDAIKNASLWNLPSNVEPTLISEKQGLHIFHSTNILPIIQAFYDGKVRDMWLNDNTPGYNVINFRATPPNPDTAFMRTLPVWGLGGNGIANNIFVVSAAKEMNAVQWAAPPPLRGFDNLAVLVENGLTRSDKCRMIPRSNEIVPGCKMCNDIMTQQATTSHFLVRKYISLEPLVPTNSIITSKLINTGANYSAHLTGRCRFDPGNDNMNKRASEFNYQGCLAYYIHRCLPARPVRASLVVAARKANVRKIMVAFSFLLLEIACLTFERFRGSEGGRKPNSKPSFRYRGTSELYLSYLFWVILSNDIPHGEAPGAHNEAFCTLDFCQFHRYFFSEVVESLAISHPAFADAYELGDVVFGENETYLFNRNAAGLMPGSAIIPPAEILEFMCNRICVFYNETLWPTFSRHMTNLAPNPLLLAPGPALDEILYNRQILVSNMIISVTVLRSMTHLLEKATVGDIDTFVESVGAHGVFWLWQRLLNMGPVCMERLMGQFMDSLTLIEYKNIQRSMSADPSKPSITEGAAESMYVCCNALDLRAEPRNEQELWDLKQGHMCSPPKSIPRLNMLGAFRQEE